MLTNLYVSGDHGHDLYFFFTKNEKKKKKPVLYFVLCELYLVFQVFLFKILHIRDHLVDDRVQHRLQHTKDISLLMNNSLLRGADGAKNKHIPAF